MCGLLVEALKRDGVNKRSNASMDKSFDGMHEKYDFDSIRCSVKKTISISMIVTSVKMLIYGTQCRRVAEMTTVVVPLTADYACCFNFTLLASRELVRLFGL